ncbi:hypothetical protein GYMLUDRAFT_669875 [Collybiopsis luxurians FD-317 M1]|uniref:Unplaced genomic scaffold GYMLUscaffold_31, whole genome shotgun sequence n=1 Tax=Collybiopsis luxurians FD-317 M1 TaxID=944289 RepID=A0A0D0CAQ6_9AGAR|nr:hypothetical protein GYMLUDRAFT_669875 [Collybiopsis luxurians FD-317 M1]
MQFLTLFSLLAVAITSVAAQGAKVGAPADMTEITAGSSFTAMIERPLTLTGSTEVAVVIGLLSCDTRACPGPSGSLGTVLYQGPFNPQLSDDHRLPPHQNFTLAVLPDFEKGQAQFGVAHFTLVGASVWPLLDTLNTTIVIT